ncbi:Hypothetical predicted protein [Mytilus galloprovincialis]|uniref:Tyr recombinase domain-containing protein n=1 Tax=Mytilus galloprovincialis TaxID=29158 RepID=A0A8B6BSD6_MYTGA|nr:Hypothetical predicted protein [Mytilus galloprovincialis]
MHFDGSPLTRYQLSAMLRKSVNFCNIPNPNLLKSHSFRIGAATEASKRGINDEAIKKWEGGRQVHLSVTSGFLGHELQSTIWIMGSSIPHWAGITAASRSGGKNLNLDRLGVQVKWITKSGMKWKDLDSSFESEIKKWPAPNYIFYSSRCK